MSILMGPVLSFRGAVPGEKSTVWRVSVLVVVDAKPPQLTVDGTVAATPEVLWSLGSKQVLRFDASVPLEANERRVKYDFGAPTGAGIRQLVTRARGDEGRVEANVGRSVSAATGQPCWRLLLSS